MSSKWSNLENIEKKNRLVEKSAVFRDSKAHVYITSKCLSINSVKHANQK